MHLSRRSVAAGIAALALVLSGGLALASPEDPALEDEVTGTETDTATTGEIEEGTEEEVEAPDTEGEDEGTTEEVELEDDSTADAEGSHGALVSAAAHEHAYDEACGNHGAYVSHIARTGTPPACATGEEAPEGDTTAAGATTAKAPSKAAAKGTSKPRAKASAKPAGRGKG